MTHWPVYLKMDLRTIEPAESQEEVTPDDLIIEEHYSSSFVPNAAPPATQRETIEQAVQSLGQPQSSHLISSQFLVLFTY